jgi:hypothetical protein
MKDKILDLRYIQAKEYLVSAINSVPQKYGISFILINEILRDIARQVEIAAINDRKVLDRIISSDVSDKEEENNNE